MDECKPLTAGLSLIALGMVSTTVGQCRLPVLKPVLKAYMGSALETEIS